MDFKKFIGTSYEENLLPAIPPDGAISRNSKINPAQRGKVPGRLTPLGWTGFSEWTKYKSDHWDLQNWSEWNANVSVNCRDVFAGLDLDSENNELNKLFVEITDDLIGTNLPSRSRSNSNRNLLLCRGNVRKRAHKYSNKHTGEMAGLDILGNKSQFIAEGTHPSGSNYEWTNGQLVNFTLDDLVEIDDSVIDQVIKSFEQKMLALGWSIISGSQASNMSSIEPDVQVRNASMTGTVDINDFNRIIGTEMVNLIKHGPSGPDGDRSSAQAKVINRLLGLGFDDNTIADIILNPDYEIGDKAREQGEDWLMTDIARLRAKLAAFKSEQTSIVGTDMQRIPKTSCLDTTQQAANDDNPVPLFTIEDSSVAHFLKKPPPDRIYLLQNCLPYGKVGAIIGPGGTSKSTFAIQLGLSVATGTDLCDGAWTIGESGQVIGLFAEEDEDELHRRVFRCSEHLSAEHKELAVKNFHVKSMVAVNNLITEKTASNEVKLTPYFDQLQATVQQFDNLKLIITDPASRFRGGDENTASDATRYVEALEKVSRTTGATVIIIHHANKASANGEASANDSRGSSALSDGLRWVMKVSTMTEKEHNPKYMLNRGNYMKVNVVKNNYAPPQHEDIWLYRGDHGVLSHAPHVGQAKVMDEKRRKAQIIQTVKSEINAGIFRSKKSFLDNYSGKNEGKFHLGRDKLNQYLDELIGDKRLDYVEATVEQKRKFKNLRKVLTVVENRT